VVSERSDSSPPSDLPDDEKARLTAEDRERLAQIYELIEQHRPVLNAFHAESDRGAILIAAQLLDGTLEALIKAVFVPDREDRLLAIDGPLGTFSTRIDFAFAIGLIPRSACGHLHRVRRIRNACAHSINAITFADQKIRDLTFAMLDVDAFLPPDKRRSRTPEDVRARFLANAALTKLDTRSCEKRSTKPPRPMPPRKASRSTKRSGVQRRSRMQWKPTG
jgi:DNA-binding MltR family transcriptional regulator